MNWVSRLMAYAHGRAPQFVLGRLGARLTLLAAICCACASLSGCASMRSWAPAELRPCVDGYARTTDGWNLGIRRYCPQWRDPGKAPVVLCHGLGLNGTFWTITDHHLPLQLQMRGYDVFVVDMRGSGGSFRPGPIGRLNRMVRETPWPEIGGGRWNVDDQVCYDIPAILRYVERATGSREVNWVGHSLGGMLMYPYLELTPEPERIRNFVGMGSTAILAKTPQIPMLRANRGLQNLLAALSTGRMARPMYFARIPGLDRVDRLYYTAANVDDRTVDRFYGYTLEDPGRGALKQLEPYLAFGHLVSADGKVDYAALLHNIKTPTLMIAGEGDIMSDVRSIRMTMDSMSSPDKELKVFGRTHGHYDDYGHCDLVWSRHAPHEIFPVLIDWLDARQPGAKGPVIDRPSPGVAEAGDERLLRDDLLTSRTQARASQLIVDDPQVAD